MAPEIFQLLKLLYDGTSDLSDQEVRMKLLYKCVEEKRCYYKYDGHIKAWVIHAYTPEELEIRNGKQKKIDASIKKDEISNKSKSNKDIP